MGIDTAPVFALAAGGAGAVGALLFLQKVQIGPDTTCSLNDRSALVIFITVIGGIGRIEGPSFGTPMFVALRELLAVLGASYHRLLGAVAVATMPIAPKGLCGRRAHRYDPQLLRLRRHVRLPEPRRH